MGFKIAGLASDVITDPNGVPHADVRTALKLTVIPSKATRSHKRTIASDKQGDTLTTVDEEGNKIEVIGRGEGIEKGESTIVLVQKSEQPGALEKIRGIFKAKTVTDRLARFVAAETEDPIKVSILAGLRDKQDEAQELILEKILERAETLVQELVEERLQALLAERIARETERVIGTDVAECARDIAGSRAATIT